MDKNIILFLTKEANKAIQDNMDDVLRCQVQWDHQTSSIFNRDGFMSVKLPEGFHWRTMKINKNHIISYVFE